MPDRARTILAQHAETTRLLGVDFLPVRPGSSLDPASAPASDDQGPNEGDHPQSPSDPPIADPPDQEIEPKPIRVGASDVAACHADLTDPRQKLEAVRAKYESDAPHASFNTTFTNIVFGEGDPSARLMFVGEAPGENEDQTGRPFVGRAGQLLDKMIGAMGLSRESVYICNVLKTRPPNNATPTPEEARLCAPYLFEQIRVVCPEVIVTLGLPASHLLLDTTKSMGTMRGQWWAFPATDPSPASPFAGMDASGLPEIPVMPTYHPAYLLRSYTEENRRKVWADLCMVVDRLGLKSGS